MKLKRVKDFLTESIDDEYYGNFKVTEDMVSEGKFIEGKIPKKINGSFDCSNLSLTTLEGGPEKVNGDFECYDNELTSLEFCPEEVNGDFDCSYNNLTSLEFGPKIVNKDFYCSNNLNDLDIEQEFILSGNYRNDYYKDLLDYMLSNDIDIKEIESWPEGFLSKNLKRSIKGKNKFNL